jgi:hypothetical protein
MRGSSWLCSLIALLCAASICAPQAAKSSGAGLAGEVIDYSCASLEKARILLVDLKSLQMQTTESGEFGAFGFPNLKPGDYTVIVAGMGPCIVPQIRQVKITEGKVTRLRVVMPLDEKCGPEGDVGR